MLGKAQIDALLDYAGASVLDVLLTLRPDWERPAEGADLGEWAADRRAELEEADAANAEIPDAVADKYE